MRKPQIAAVIAEHGLVAGQTMKNVRGEDIPGSVVLDATTFIHPKDGTSGGWELWREQTIQGDEISLYLSNKAMSALKAIDA